MLQLYYAGGTDGSGLMVASNWKIDSFMGTPSSRVPMADDYIYFISTYPINTHNSYVINCKKLNVYYGSVTPANLYISASCEDLNIEGNVYIDDGFAGHCILNVSNSLSIYGVDAFIRDITVLGKTNIESANCVFDTARVADIDISDSEFSAETMMFSRNINITGFGFCMGNFTLDYGCRIFVTGDGSMFGRDGTTMGSTYLTGGDLFLTLGAAVYGVLSDGNLYANINTDYTTNGIASTLLDNCYFKNIISASLDIYDTSNYEVDLCVCFYSLSIQFDNTGGSSYIPYLIDCWSTDFTEWSSISLIVGTHGNLNDIGVNSSVQFSVDGTIDYDTITPVNTILAGLRLQQRWYIPMSESMFTFISRNSCVGAKTTITPLALIPYPPGAIRMNQKTNAQGASLL